MKICGDFGGKKRDGKPCELPAGWGTGKRTGRCKHHKKKRGRGRPRLNLDKTQIETLARINCTHEEIAAVMGCSVDTISRNYAELINKARLNGKTSLRRAQWKKALSGNTGMLIWLGKQELGQSDRHDFEHSGPDGGPIPSQINIHLVSTDEPDDGD